MINRPIKDYASRMETLSELHKQERQNNDLHAEISRLQSHIDNCESDIVTLTTERKELREKLKVAYSDRDEAEEDYRIANHDSEEFESKWISTNRRLTTALELLKRLEPFRHKARKVGIHWKPACPFCENTEQEGHKPECRLAKLLAGGRDICQII